MVAAVPAILRRRPAVPRGHRRPLRRRRALPRPGPPRRAGQRPRRGATGAAGQPQGLRQGRPSSTRRWPWSPGPACSPPTARCGARTAGSCSRRSTATPWTTSPRSRSGPPQLVRGGVGRGPRAGSSTWTTCSCGPRCTWSAAPCSGPTWWTAAPPRATGWWPRSTRRSRWSCAGPPGRGPRRPACRPRPRGGWPAPGSPSTRACAAMVRPRRARAEPGHDVLGLLLASGLSDAEVRDELVTLVIAGHETVAASLTWTLRLLAEHPEVVARVHAELDEVLADGGRRHPHGDLDRRAAPAGGPGGRRRGAAALPAGLGDHAPGPGRRRGRRGAAARRAPWSSPRPWVHHRRADLWPEPLRFDVDRWLGQDAGARREGYLPVRGGAAAVHRARLRGGGVGRGARRAAARPHRRPGRAAARASSPR